MHAVPLGRLSHTPVVPPVEDADEDEAAAADDDDTAATEPAVDDADKDATAPPEEAPLAEADADDANDDPPPVDAPATDDVLAPLLPMPPLAVDDAGAPDEELESANVTTHRPPTHRSPPGHWASALHASTHVPRTHCWPNVQSRWSPHSNTGRAQAVAMSTSTGTSRSLRRGMDRTLAVRTRRHHPCFN